MKLSLGLCRGICRAPLHCWDSQRPSCTFLAEKSLLLRSSPSVTSVLANTTITSMRWSMRMGTSTVRPWRWSRVAGVHNRIESLIIPSYCQETIYRALIFITRCTPHLQNTILPGDGGWQLQDGGMGRPVELARSPSDLPWRLLIEH